MSLEIASVKSPLTKYKKTNKPIITLIIIVLIFGEIENKGSIIDFQKFQTLWLLKKNHELKRENWFTDFCLYHKKINYINIKSQIIKCKVSKFKKHNFCYTDNSEAVSRCSTHTHTHTKKCYSQKFRNTHMKTPLPESLCNKFAGPQAWNFINKKVNYINIKSQIINRTIMLLHFTPGVLSVYALPTQWAL